MSLEARLNYHRLFMIFSRWADRALTAQTLQMVSDVALTPAQARCLDFLSGRTHCSVGELAEGLAVSDPAATKLIDRLQRKGLVNRQTHPEDRRVVFVTLSQTGAALTAELDRSRESMVDAATRAISARALEQLADHLEQVLLAALDSPQLLRRVCLRCGEDHSAECVVNRAHIGLAGCEMSRR